MNLTKRVSYNLGTQRDEDVNIRMLSFIFSIKHSANSHQVAPEIV